MKTLLYLLIYFHFFAVGCTREQYRVDSKNKLNKHATKSNEYLANQAIKITHKNLSRKEKERKKSIKISQQITNELNELNKNSSKVKKKNQHNGTFSLY